MEPFVCPKQLGLTGVRFKFTFTVAKFTFPLTVPVHPFCETTLTKEYVPPDVAVITAGLLVNVVVTGVPAALYVTVQSPWPVRFRFRLTGVEEPTQKTPEPESVAVGAGASVTVASSVLVLPHASVTVTVYVFVPTAATFKVELVAPLLHW